MVMYDANDDEVHHINYGKLDEIDDNLFQIQHPEPYVRPAIALNLSTNQIAELRGVCFTDSFNVPHKNETEPNWCASKTKYLDKYCVLKIFVSLILIIGWSLFTFGIVKNYEVNEREGWMFLTLMFVILLLTTLSLRKMISRCHNRNDSSSDPFLFHGTCRCLPCCRGTKDEEERILYSLKT